MPDFQFQAVNAQQQLVSGQLQAGNVAEALSQLEARGLVVQSIGYVAAGLPGAPPAPAADTAADTGSGPEHAALQTYLGRVMERGQAMVPPLRAFAAELPAGRNRRQLNQAIDVLQRGDAAAAAAQLPRLPEFWIPLLSAATASSDPGRILSQFLEESQRASELRRQWWRSLAYPVAIVLLSLAVLALLSLTVVPVFREMFIEFDLPLPAATVLILNVAAFISSGWALIPVLAVIAALLLLGPFSAALPGGLRSTLDDWFATPLGRRVAVARLARFSADLLEAGMEVPAALRISGHCTHSPRLQRAAGLLAQEAERNDRLPPLERRHPLTQTVVYALRGPVPDAARIRLLREVGQSHAQRAAKLLSWSQGMMEPLAVCVLGILVGFTVLALLSPLVHLIQGLSGGLA
jgi:type II secretory pathway component PulF